MLSTNHDTSSSYKRLKQVRQQSKMNERTTVQNVEKETNRILDDISDILLIQKIHEKNRKLDDLAEDFEENEIDSLEFLKQIEKEEEKQLKDEYEAIVKKQLQALQADERGKQALATEIREIKKRQEKRAEALKARKHALEIERDRSKKIASLPPPLPKSIKSLLKQRDNDGIKNDPVLTPLVTRFNPSSPKEKEQAPTILSENKENILDEKEIEKNAQLQEEWNMKAKKRFYEALRKDRKKQEYDEILKQIQNAERIARREIAKNVSKKEKKLPFALSDKLLITEKQADMEGAVEKVYKNCNKEHVIEDIEGYEDYWEPNYKKVDSDFEAKMVDCVPSFVKNNYEYLLKDESKFQCGKNFINLDDTEDNCFNEAFIETPEATIGKSEDIDNVISQLDEMRSELKTTYEDMLKPLLEAELNAPKIELTDKAVETDGMHLCLEDKAVETDLYEEVFTSPKLPSYLNAENRRGYGSIFSSASDFNKRQAFQQESGSHFDQAVDVEPESWSSSSYYSLPSKHGIPKLSSECDICVTEFSDQNTNPCSNSENFSVFSDKPSKEPATLSTDKKFPISSVVQKLAEKYLGKKSDIVAEPKRTFVEDIDYQQGTLKSSRQNANVAFEKVKLDNFNVISRPAVSLSISDRRSLEPVVNEASKNLSAALTCKSKPGFSRNSDVNILNAISELTLNNEQALIKNNCNEISAPSLSSEDPESIRLELIRQVIFKNISSLPSTSNKSEKFIDKIYPDDINLPFSAKGATQSLAAQNIVATKPYLYHELSTIQEIDSALIDNTQQESFADEILEKSFEKKVIADEPPKSQTESKNKFPDKSAEHMHPISLLDIPHSEVSECVRKIHFVTKEPNKIDQPLEIPKDLTDELERPSDLLEQTMLTSAPSNAKNGSKSIISPPSSLQSTNLHVSSLSEKSSDVPISNNLFKTSSPFLKSTDLLAQYFKDVSSIQELRAKTRAHQISSQFANMSDNTLSTIHHENTLSSATSSPMYRNEFKNSDAKSTHKMNNYVYDESSSDSFKPMTPHSTLSSPNIMKHNILHPLPTQLNSLKRFEKQQLTSISSAKDLLKTEHNFMQNYVLSDSSGSFQPMTAHSSISLPESLEFRESPLIMQSRGKESNNRNYKCLSPKTKLSLEGNHQDNKSIKKWHALETSSTGSFNPMTPHSNLSFPSVSNSELDTGVSCDSYVKDANVLNFGANSESIKSLKMRFDVSTPNSMETFRNEKYLSNLKQPQFPSKRCIINCQVTLRTKSNSKSPTRTNSSPTRMSDKKFFEESIPQKERAHSNSSGFFTPHLVTSDSSTTVCEDISLPEGSLYNIGSADYPQIETFEPNSKLLRESFSSASDVEVIRSDLPSRHGVLSDLCLEELSLIKDYENVEKGFLNSASYKVILNSMQKQKGSESYTNLSEKGHRALAISKFADLSEEQNFTSEELDIGAPNLLKAIPSNSSDGQLSELSGSKVVCQSTPVKSLEELIQETGIMEEPDLTLITSEYTCRAVSPVKCNREFGTHYEDFTQFNAGEEQNTANLPQIQIENSPTTERLLCNADTPSMLSFLQHEASCLQDSEKSLQIPEASKVNSEKPHLLNVEQKRQENTPTCLKQNYKKRTKRLWNNLEEVKKKELAAEQKRLLALNRIKVKEFAKKLATPKKK